MAGSAGRGEDLNNVLATCEMRCPILQTGGTPFRAVAKHLHCLDSPRQPPLLAEELVLDRGHGSQQLQHWLDLGLEHLG